jgi:signal transduction histidine kinase
MFFQSLKLRHKIVLPFMLLFVAAIIVTAYVSTSLMSRQLDSRLTEQIHDVLAIVSQGDFAFNTEILQQLKVVLDADIVTFGKNGRVLAGTLSEDSNAGILEMVFPPNTVEQILGDSQRAITRDVLYADEPYRIAYHSLPNAPQTFIAFVVPISDIAAAKNDIAKAISLLTAVIIVIVIVVSQVIARGVTTPLQKLLAHTRKLAAGDWSTALAVEGDDEVARLGRAYNEMAVQLREYEEKLLHSEKLALTGQLAARVAHDIRNPLSSIKMQAQMLRNKLKSLESDPSPVQHILDEIDRVEWVVQGLLDLSKPGDLELVESPVEGPLEEALAAGGPQLRHFGIAVEKHFEPGLPPAKLDPLRFKQALLNLIVNATEEMPHGGTLTVGARLSASGETLEIEIKDDGPGIDPSVRDNLFDPFVTTKREGVGLGLVNTKSIIERHGGSIAVEPGEDGGTRVIITIPRQSVADAQEVTHG